MKTLIFFALVASCAAFALQNDESSVGLAKKQMVINQLLYKINDPIQSRFVDTKERSQKYIPIDHLSYYDDNGDGVTSLEKDMTDGRVLEQHHWFSLFNNQHRAEAIHFFEILMNAKSWSIFANTAAYYREKLNEGVFVYALYVSVMHSRYAEGIVLPPLYEVTPHMFANSEVIQEAYSAKMKQVPAKISMSFTGSRRNPEQRVAYFGEDIGLNVHHVTWHMEYPFWWKDSYGSTLDRKGELFFWAHHQLTSRFDSERLSNNLDIVDELYWDRPIYEGFAPHTTYKYGGEFPTRPDNVDFEDVDGVARIRDMLIYENRIRDAIAHGYITGPDGKNINIRNDHGIEVLGDVIESSNYSPNIPYYGAMHNLAHIILGRQGDPHGKFANPPGVMEHFETATRDPAFFRLHKYIDNMFKEHKHSLPSYTSAEIGFDGVTLEEVSVDGKLSTFFEDFEFELGNGVDDAENVKDLKLSAVVSRLNHAPFNYNLKINNDNSEDTLATIRIYLCPTRDSNGIRFTWLNGLWGCIEMDKFWKKLDHGLNRIERSSQDSTVTTPDTPGFRDIAMKTKAAVETGKALGLEKYKHSCGIPNRLLLPKGTQEGMDFDVLVAVTNGKNDAVYPDIDDEDHYHSHTHCGIQGSKYPDKKPMGYPFDRRVTDSRTYTNSQNIRYTSVKVYHRG